MVELTEPTGGQTPYLPGLEHLACLLCQSDAIEGTTVRSGVSASPAEPPGSAHERGRPSATVIAITVGPPRASEIAWCWRGRRAVDRDRTCWSQARHGAVAAHWGATGATLWAARDALQDAAREQQATSACAQHRPMLWLADRHAATILSTRDDDVWQQRLAMVIREQAAEVAGREVPSRDEWYHLVLRCRALHLACGDRVLLAPAAVIARAMPPKDEPPVPAAEEDPPAASPRPGDLTRLIVCVRCQLQTAHATACQAGAALPLPADTCEAGSAAGLLSDAYFAIQHAADTLERASRYLQASVSACREDQRTLIGPAT